MKKLRNITFYRTKILPTLIILIALVFAGSVAYAFSPKPDLESTSKIKASNAKVVNQKQIKTKPSPTPENVLGASTYNPLASPTIVVKSNAAVNTNPTITQKIAPQNTNPTNTNTSNSNNQQSGSTNTVLITPTTATPTPTTQTTVSPTVLPTQTMSTVSLQIQSPDGTSNFPVTLKDGVNVCDVLQEAKDEGKINSVTFDDSYMSSLHSKYVYEINGYKNNWTFTVNGNSPLGCSLSHPKPNDSLVWKFG